MKVFIFGCLFYYSLLMVLGCVGSVNRVERGKNIMWDNCKACHAPAVKLRGISIREMKDRYTPEEMRQVLLLNFSSKTELVLEAHKNIKLSKKDIDNLIEYLDYDNDSCNF